MSPTDPPPPNFPPPPPSDPGPGVPPTSGGFNVGEAFSWAWKKFQANAATLVVGTLILAVVAAVLYFVGALIIGAIFGSGVSVDPVTLDDSGNITGGGVESRGFFISLLLSALGGFVASVAVYILAASYVRVLLRIADGESPEIGEFFKFERIDKTVILGLILAVGSLIGTVLCYFPALIWGFLTAFALYFLVDKNEEPVDAVKSSISLTTGNVGTLILVYLAALATVFVGAVACGVGLLVAAPVAGLVYAYTFRSLSGGRVAA